MKICSPPPLIRGHNSSGISQYFQNEKKIDIVLFCFYSVIDFIFILLMKQYISDEEKYFSLPVSVLVEVSLVY